MSASFVGWFHSWHDSLNGRVQQPRDRAFPNLRRLREPNLAHRAKVEKGQDFF